MNNLINVTLNENQEPVVSGRQLHQVLGVKTRYDNWFNRMTEYGFTENQDYLVTSIFGHNSKGGKQSKVDHVLKLDMAKEISMIQRTDKGKEVRQYFIQVEKDLTVLRKSWLELLKLLTVKLLNLKQQLKSKNLKLSLLTQSAQVIRLS